MSMPTTDQFGRQVSQGAGYRFGRRLSQIFHPTWNGIAALIVVALLDVPGMALAPRLTWALAVVVVVLVPPTLYFQFRLQQGRISDDDVSLRHERTELYLVSVLSILAGGLILRLFGLPVAFVRLIGAGIATVVACAAINLFWKISVHSASMGTLATLLSLFLWPAGLVFWLVAAAVGWARIRTGNHTALQVVAGWGVAALGVLVAFRLGR
ncbi:MAG: phosphatase PAP2 family protein [Herpetosiphon sp.]